ncbi:SET domain-containing protein 4 [Cherax quadricarinatus]|uniref:SET domain-containing protein 4 n=1 Tax=Cherax quadricarinatus TaxID=27406 RepID=UPI00387E7BCF
MDNLKEKREIAAMRSKPSGRTWRRRKKKCRVKQQGVYSYPVDANPVLVKLSQWLKSKGCKLSSCTKLRPAVFADTGRGLMATVGVNVGDVLVSIPKQALVTCCKILEDAELKNLHKVPQKFRAMEILTFFLLYHKYLGNNSEWKPYLDSLPNEYTVPAYSSLEEISLFPELLKSRIFEQVEDVDQCYASIKTLVLLNSKHKQLFSSLCVDDVKWGWFTVNTRCVYLKEDNPAPFILDDVYALVPFLDLLNHSCNSQVTTNMNESNGCYEIVTQVPFAKYEQVFINYGPHDNIKLYIEYGFTLKDNPHNYVPVNIDDIISSVRCIVGNALRKDALYEKTKLVRAHNIDKSLGFSSDGPSWNMRVATTIYLMTPEELSRWQVVYEDLDGIGHRKLVMECLIQIIQKKVCHLQTFLFKVEHLQGCSKAFAVGGDLLRECCMLLENINIIENT